MNFIRPSSFFVGLLALGLAPNLSSAGLPDALDVSELEPGMLATVKTVLRGTEIEEFQVELVSVVHDVAPNQDMILARAIGEEIEHLGVAQGMSGSPVYVDGKLVGALSSTWSFLKDPLLGITPVHQMESEASWSSAALDASGSAPHASPGVPALREASSVGPALAGVTATDRLRAGAPPAADRGFAPIASPLVLSGFDRRVVNLVADLFEPYGFTVVEGGAAGKAQRGGKIEPGATLGVRLAGGDVNMTAIGAVTWVDGDRVHGWGHPFFQMGDVEMPLVSGYIHAIMPSRMLSFKLGSGGEVVGTLTNDRRSGISGRLGAGPRLTNFDLTVTQHGKTDTYHYELVRHPILGPALVGVVAANSILARAGTFSEETVRFVQNIRLDDGRETTVETLITGEQTVGQIVDLLSQAASVIVTNPFEAVNIDQITAELIYEPGLRAAFLTEAWIDDDQLEPGDTVTGTYIIQDYRGAETRHRFSIPLPADAREARYLLVVADSRTAEQYEAERAPRQYQPRTLDEFLARIDRLKQTDQVHLQLYRQSEGVLIDGRPLPDLPPSVLSVFRGASRSGQEDHLPAEIVWEDQVSIGRFLSGGHSILFEVRKENR